MNPQCYWNHHDNESNENVKKIFAFYSIGNHFQTTEHKRKDYKSYHILSEMSSHFNIIFVKIKQIFPFLNLTFCLVMSCISTQTNNGIRDDSSI